MKRKVWIFIVIGITLFTPLPFKKKLTFDTKTVQMNDVELRLSVSAVQNKTSTYHYDFFVRALFTSPLISSGSECSATSGWMSVKIAEHEHFTQQPLSEDNYVVLGITQVKTLPSDVYVDGEINLGANCNPTSFKFDEEFILRKERVTLSSILFDSLMSV